MTTLIPEIMKALDISDTDVFNLIGPSGNYVKDNGHISEFMLGDGSMWHRHHGVVYWPADPFVLGMLVMCAYTVKRVRN